MIPSRLAVKLHAQLQGEWDSRKKPAPFLDTLAVQPQRKAMMQTSKNTLLSFKFNLSIGMLFEFSQFASFNVEKQQKY